MEAMGKTRGTRGLATRFIRTTGRARPWHHGGIILAVLLAACGGGAGSATDTSGAVIATAAEFWCADAGDLWLYDGLDSTTGRAYRNRTTIGAPLSIGGVTLDAFESTRPYGDLPMAGTQYRFFDSDQGICACLEAAPTDLALSYVELPAEIRKGSYRAFERTVPIPGGTETLQIDVSVAGFEPVVLPAGSFDALKVTHRFTLTLRVNEQVSSGYSELHLWYARDIGVIQQVLDQPSAAPATGTYVERLAGVRVASSLAGVVGEFTLLDDLGPGTSDTTTGRPGAACDGSGYLVAARSYDSDTKHTEIVGAYVDGQGRTLWRKTLIDNLGLAFGGSAYSDPVPVVFDGTDFWVVARRSELNSRTLVRQRVSPAGDLLDSADGIVVGEGYWPVLASNGDSVLLVYSRYVGQPDWVHTIEAMLFNTNGSVARDPERITERAVLPAVTASGDQYLVSFEGGDSFDVRALRLGATGALLDAVPIAVSTAPESQGNCALAPWGREDFLAVWSDMRDARSGYGEADIYGARVSGDGLLLDGPAESGGVPINQHESWRAAPAVTTGEAGTLAVYSINKYANLQEEPTGLFARRFAPDAELVVDEPTSNGILVALLTREDGSAVLDVPAAASGETAHFVVWVHSDTEKRVRGALVYPPVNAGGAP